MKKGTGIFSLVNNCRAQILLPAVLLAPIFILVIYLLFETAKVSMTKVRQQFALDNAAYSQISAASTYLNALAMINGPLPYRVLLSQGQQMDPLQAKEGSKVGTKAISVFELFYQGGGVPAIGPDHETGINNPPSPDATDWKIQYYAGDNLDEEARVRAQWEKEDPGSPPDPNKHFPIMSKKLVENYFFWASGGEDAPFLPAVKDYLETYARLGSIYKSQDYAYKEVSKDAIMFREAYYLNVNDCKRSDCARQSASQIRQVLDLPTKPFDLAKIMLYVSNSGKPGTYHSGSRNIPFDVQDVLSGDRLFQFAYLTQSARGKLKSLSHGVLLKQPFKLPLNRFNINLEQKYKPYVRNRVVMTCPRGGNNCVWPNPLPKYTITLEP